MKKSFNIIIPALFAFVFILTGTVIGQQSVSEGAVISGIAVDYETGEPLLEANVYLVNTFFGCAADDKGNFIIFKVPPGVYLLITSYVGYETGKTTIKITGADTIQVDFRLKQKSFKTGEVVVTAETAEEWTWNLKFFKREFFGQSVNVRDCKLLNPEVLSFTGVIYSEYISATAEDILQVENRALGYKLYLLLDEFVYNRGMIRYRVYPRFEYLTPQNGKEEKKWKDNRASTYAGSQKHFFRALWEKRLADEGFAIYITYALPPDDYFSKKIVQDSIVTTDQYTFEKEILFANYLKVVYLRGETGKRKSLGRGMRDKTMRSSIADKGIRKPVTWIALIEPPVIFDKFGYVLDPYRLMIYGDWINSRIADVLPRDYIPVR